MTVTGKEKNLRVLRPFRLNGEHIEAGSVISKDEFGEGKHQDIGAWSELCVMNPQTCTQTDDDLVRVPSPREAAAKPAAKKAMP
jgi:hypothetical protein